MSYILRYYVIRWLVCDLQECVKMAKVATFIAQKKTSNDSMLGNLKHKKAQICMMTAC